MSLPPRVRRVLMSIDAVGGVWRYALDLAAGLRDAGVETVFACLGPPPSPRQRAEAEAVGRLVALDAPLDWLAGSAAELAEVPGRLAALAEAEGADLLHLNLPSQAAGIDTRLPVVVVSHSCVVTWFAAVRGTGLPPGWEWQRDLNAAGLEHADLVLVPSASHGDMVTRAYGPLPALKVVFNASAATEAKTASPRSVPFIFGAGRWWDEGKNAASLDAAAALTSWPIRLAGALAGPNGAEIALQHAEPIGEIAHADLRQVLEAAEIFVSPSVYEPFGLAALEAAVAGKPMVLADIPTYRELWQGAALFADPRDPAEIAARLNALAEDPDLRQRLGTAARERSRRYSLTAQRDAVLAAYAAAAARKSQPTLRAS